MRQAEALYESQNNLHRQELALKRLAGQLEAHQQYSREQLMQKQREYDKKADEVSRLREWYTRQRTAILTDSALYKKIKKLAASTKAGQEELLTGKEWNAVYRLVDAVCPPLSGVLDAAGTFADDLVLETLNEDSANVAYELTFLLAGVACFIYVVLVKKQRLLPQAEVPKYTGAIFETAGQFAYIYAIADTEHLAMSAPIISAYCAASVLWSRLFLKEKLSWKHYAMILLVVIGIVIMGVFDM